MMLYVVRVPLLLLLLLCCNYYSVNGRRTSSFVSSWAHHRIKSTTFLVHHHTSTLASRRTSSPRTSTTIAAAAIMTPENSASVGSGGASSNTNKKDAVTLPNWRVVDVHNNNNDHDDVSTDIVSPFYHSLQQQQSNNNQSPSTILAPWSQEAYEQSLTLYKQLSNCNNDPYISPLIKTALHDIEMSFRLYGPTNMISSYNGGKDAVVIFHLVRAVHAHYYSQLLLAEEEEEAESNNTNLKIVISRPRVIYFQHDHEFPQVLSLLHDTVQKYDVDMIAFKEGTSFGDGLKYLVERNLAPSPTTGRNTNNNTPPPPPYPLAFVLGTRKDDPNAGSQGVYAPSSHYMPPFLRVNPILDWTYGAVWYFLRLFDLPYCTLYDDGYTSLGTVKDTLPCPALKKNDNNSDGGDEDEYWPAYMLRDWSQERAGRIDKKKEKKEQKKSKENDESVLLQKDKAVGVTMSQTSSTVSLPPTTVDNETSKLTGSMSTILNISEEEAQGDTNSRKNTSHNGRPTVGLIVIGDELLKGMTPDSNIISAAKALRLNNVTLSRVSIISDDLRDIVDEIQRFMNDVDVIITSGGVGPTHDDVTIKSVAEALNLEMEMNVEMAELLIQKMGSSDANDTKEEEDTHTGKKSLSRQLSVGQKKMATLPTSSVLQYLTDDTEEWPVLQCQNIFILPGVPLFFDKKIQQLAAHLCSTTYSTDEDNIGLNVDQSAQTEAAISSTTPPRSDTYRIVLSLPEDEIVAALNASVVSHPHVSFGSYPIVDDPELKTIITLEGRFYNGGYNKESERLLGMSLPNESSGSDRIKSMFFSKEAMDKNVELALSDMKSRLPKEGILFIDTCDDLRIK